MRIGRALLGFAALTLTLILASCGGSGIGTSFGMQPGIYLVDQGSNRIVWLADMNATFFSSFGPALTGVTNITNGSIDPFGRLYLIDSTTKAIVRFDDLAADGRISIGTAGSGTGQFLNPVRVGADFTGKIYVVDRGRNALIRFTPTFSTWDVFDLSPWFLDSDEPDVAFDHFGHIYLAGGSHIVRLNGLSAAGAVVFGSSGTGVNQFNSLNGIAVDGQGRIYLADGSNNRIVRISDMTGGGWLAFGSTGAGLNQFNIPYGIGVDHLGKIYIGDRNNNRLVRIDTMTGVNWTELDNLPSSSFNFPGSVFPHVPTF